MTKTLQQKIDAARKRCEKAFKGVKKGEYAWCCHHDIRIERLYADPSERIRVIVNYKPEEERVVRLNNFRPVKGVKADLIKEIRFSCYFSLSAKSKIALIRQHRKEVPKHTFKYGDIFGGN